MPEYYVDLETTGLDAKKDMVVAIAYQRLGMLTGRGEGNLTILKAWETSEKDVLERFLPVFMGGGPFSFVAIGLNIPFIYSFIVERSRIHGLEAPDPLYLMGSKPYLDLKPLLVMMNNGSFKGASLENFTDLSSSSDMVPKAFYENDHKAILDHILEKSSEFLRLYRHLKEVMPELSVKRPAPDQRSVLTI